MMRVWGSCGPCAAVALALASIGCSDPASVVGQQLPAQGRYPVVGTGQKRCYDELQTIACPEPGQPFYGQDAQCGSVAPAYLDNGDGTVTDPSTGLMWTRSPDTDGDGNIDAADKLSFSEAVASAASVSVAGYDDWRLPTIKELYSLIHFDGLDPSGMAGAGRADLTPFIDTDHFAFGYGDTSVGERIIDAQFVTSTVYLGTTMGGAATVFGVNFADGRIKGYPTGPMPGRSEEKGYYVLYVRGNTAYGVNDFRDNGDGTVTDHATDLMWSRDDDGAGMDWADALAWVAQKNADGYLGRRDWRLPTAKELQSIVDYTRAPDVTGSAAIDPVFATTPITNEAGEPDYPAFWSSTTHANLTATAGSHAAYVCFGRCMGYMHGSWMDVHGAGAQRSDPKAGDPADWPYGRGPQGDAIRIHNFVRVVRDVTTL